MHRKYIYYIIFISIVFFHIMTNLIIARINFDSNPYSIQLYGGIGDQIERLKIIDKMRSFSAGGQDKSRLSNFISIFKTPEQRPMGTYIIDAAFALCLGDNHSFFLSGIYLFILLVCTYLIGKNFYGNFAGFLSALLVSFYPGIFQSLGWLNADFPLTVFTILGFYLLMISDNLEKIVAVAAFGIILGCGILIKGSILIFLLMPIIFSIAMAVKSRDFKKIAAYTPFLNLISAFTITGIISSLWLGGSLGIVYPKVMSHLYLYGDKALIGSAFFLSTMPAGFWEICIYKATSLLAYFIKISSVSLLLAFIFSIIAGIRKDAQYRILFIFFIFPLIVISFSSVSQPRYFIPLLPFMAVMTAGEITHMQNLKFRNVSISFLCIFCFAQFFIMLPRKEDFGVKNESLKRVYSEYHNIAQDFFQLIEAQKEITPRVAFISESQFTHSDHFVLFKYLFMHEWPKNKKALPIDRGEDLGNSNFVIFMLDKRYLFKIASLLESARNNTDKKYYLSLLEECLPWRRNNLFNIMAEPEGLNKQITLLVRRYINNPNEESQVRLYEKIILLEAIKRGMVNLTEASDKCRFIFPDLINWWNIYNISGVEGLSEKFSLDNDEFVSFVKDGIRINKPFSRADMHVYTQIRRNNLKLLSIGNISYLGVDFYLFAHE